MTGQMTQVVKRSLQPQSPSSRIQVLDFPKALPGKCIVCGSVGGDGRKFIDIGLDIDFYGVVYFCTPCYLQGCNHLGFASPEQVNFLNLEIEKAINTIAALETENVKLRAGLAQLDFLGTIGSSTSTISEPNETDEKEGSNDPLSVESSNGGGRTDSKKSATSGDPIDDLI